MTVDAAASSLADALARACPEFGIDLAGAVALDGPAPHAAAWRRWLDDGLHGGLDYLERSREERADPRVRNPEATTMLVFAQRYTDGSFDEQRGTWLDGVARYAHGLDYHDVLLKAVRGLLRDLAVRWPGFEAFPVTDTGPYLERDWAVAAGLGFIGRNTCLIHEALGSGLLLAVAPCNLVLSDLDGTPRPLYQVADRGRLPRTTTDRCGTCTRCLEACPTGALFEPHRLDACRCLSTWTIEWRGRAPEDRRQEQGSRLFGCDICQQVCPWNDRARRQQATRPRRPTAYDPLPAHDTLDLAALITMGPDEFRSRFRRTPLWRQHPEGLRRNALVVAANTNRTDLCGLVANAATDDPDPEVRTVAAWAAVQMKEAP